MTKKILSLLLALIMVLGLMACGGEEQQPETESETEAEETIDRTHIYGSYSEKEISLSDSFFETEEDLIAASFGGNMADRLVGQMNNWMYTAYYSNSGMIEAFRQRESTMLTNMVQWYGEFPGKYLYSMALIYNLNHDENLKEVAEELINTLKSVQDDDGYLGVFSKDRRMLNKIRADINGTVYNNMTWDMWNQYHIIRGLLEWNKLTGNAEAMELAKSVADYIINYFSSGHTLSEVEEADKNLSIVSAYVDLYTMTNEKKYLDFVNDLIAAWEGPNGGDFIREGAKNTAYNGLSQSRWETLHALLGIGKAYELSKNETLLTAFTNLFNWVKNYDRHATGGVMSGEQATGSPYGSQGGSVETCATVAWIEVCAEALKITGDPTIADELELSTLNAIMGAQNPSGRSFVYDITETGYRIVSTLAIKFQSLPGTPELNCCAAYGPCGLGLVSKWAVLTDEAGMSLNYFGDSQLETKTPEGNKVILTQNTTYPSDGEITLNLALEKSEEFTLKIRVPQWSKNTEISVDGQAIEAKPGTYAEIKKTWNNGDKVSIKLDMEPHFWAGEERRTGSVAIYVGPILLTYDERFNGANLIDSLSEHPLSGLTLTKVDNTNVPGSPEPVVLYEATFGDGTKMILCDYGTAGQAGTRFTTWIPVSDSEVITGSEPQTRWLGSNGGN